MALMEFREQNQVKWQGSRPGHNGEQVYGYKAVEAATAILYTVPAGKTFFLCTLVVSYITVAAGYAGVFWRDDGDVYLGPLIVDTQVANVAGNSKIVTYWPPFEVASGYDVYVRGVGAGLYIYGICSGWIE